METDKELSVRMLITLLQSEYPNSFVNYDERLLKLKIELWEKEFANDDLNLIYAAIRTYMRSPERFAPTIGQVREIMNTLTAGEELPEQTAWAMVSAACRNGLYGYKKEFDKLPPDVQAAVGAPEQLKAWAMMDADTVESVVASNFVRNFKANKAREKARAALPPEMQNLISGVADKMKLGGGTAEKKAIADKPKPAALPIPLTPMTYQPQEPKPRPQPVKAEEYKPLPEDEWARRREELLKKLAAQKGGDE